MVVSDNTAEFNGAMVLPGIDDPTTLNGRWNNYPLVFDRRNVSMYCGGGLANCSVYATLWYTKSTD